MTDNIKVEESKFITPPHSPLVVKKCPPAPKKKEIGYSERQVTKQDLFVLQRLPLSNDEILKLISEIPDRRE